MIALTREQLRQSCPSIFTDQAWGRMSDRYRVARTSEVIDLLEDQGLHPVRAKQSRSRIEGKAPFVRHSIRFRREQDLNAAVAEVIPEVIVTNSFDGSTGFRLDLGLWRICCMNGLCCPTVGIGGLNVRHSGGWDYRSRILEASQQVIEQAPKALETVEAWKAIALTRPFQLALAEEAWALKPNPAVRPVQLLTSQRPEDDAAEDGSRSLWVCMNTIEEHLIKGGIQAKNANGRRIKTRPVTAVEADLRIHKRLWEMAQSTARLN